MSKAKLEELKPSTRRAFDTVPAEQGGGGKSGGPATEILGVSRYFRLEPVG
jgi:hypothetical protein